MSSREEQTRISLNGHGIFAIIVFAVVSLICIQSIHLPIPHAVTRAASQVRRRLIGEHTSEKATKGPGQESEPQAANSQDLEKRLGRKYIVLNHVWTPAIGILFLLASKTIGGEQIKLGIIGEEGVEPYDVLALFISLAYIAISLDATGLLRYLAFQVCLKAGSNGYALYFILFAFFWFLGVLVGNDPVILSGTSFLVHLTRVAGISPPSAWIWAQFVAANISSAVLVSSNPTNLVIATGFNITFPVYTAYMILPSFVSAMVSLAVLLLFFRNRTQPKAVASKDSTMMGLHAVRRWAMGLSRSGLRIRTLQGNTNGSSNGGDIALSHMPPTGANQAKEEQKKIPLIFIPPTIIRPDVDARAALVDGKGAIFNSCIMAATLITLIVTSVFGNVKVYMIAAPGAGICLIRDLSYDWYTWRSFGKKSATKPDSEHSRIEVEQNENEEHGATGDGNGNGNGKATISEKQVKPLLASTVLALKHLTEVFPTVTYVLARLPFPLLPFAFGMFILVQSLAYVGFINIMAGGIGKVCSSGPAACAFFISILGVILCNVRKFSSPCIEHCADALVPSPAWRDKHWCDDSLDKGSSVICFPIPVESFGSRLDHQSCLFFRCIWFQCWCFRGNVCCQFSRFTVARCTSSTRCSGDKDAILAVV